MGLLVLLWSDGLTEFTAIWISAWGSRLVLWSLYINCFFIFPFFCFVFGFVFGFVFLLCYPGMYFMTRLSISCSAFFAFFLATRVTFLTGPLHARKTNNSPTILAAHPLVNLLQRSDAFLAMSIAPWVDNTVYNHWIFPCPSLTLIPHSVGWLVDFTWLCFLSHYVIVIIVYYLIKSYQVLLRYGLFRLFTG